MKKKDSFNEEIRSLLFWKKLSCSTNICPTTTDLFDAALFQLADTHNKWELDRKETKIKWKFDFDVSDVY